MSSLLPRCPAVYLSLILSAFSINLVSSANLYNNHNNNNYYYHHYYNYYYYNMLILLYFSVAWWSRHRSSPLPSSPGLHSGSSQRLVTKNWKTEANLAENG